MALSDKEDLFSENMEYQLPRWKDLPDLDLYMDQVIALMGKYLEKFDFQGEKALTPSMINNYVKMEALPCPVKKKYSKIHLSHLLIICIMKQIMPINSVAKLIQTLLKYKKEEELLDFFAEAYEQVFCRVFEEIKILGKGFDENAGDETLSLSMLAVYAAAVSSSGKFLAEKAIGLLPEQKQEKSKD